MLARACSARCAMIFAYALRPTRGRILPTLPKACTMTSAIDRRHVGARLSETAIHNGTVYLAGQIPENSPGADIKTQTQEVLGHIDRLLGEAGSSKQSILSCQIFLTDISEIGQMNEV